MAALLLLLLPRGARAEPSFFVPDSTALLVGVGPAASLVPRVSPAVAFSLGVEGLVNGHHGVGGSLHYLKQLPISVLGSRSRSSVVHLALGYRYGLPRTFGEVGGYFAVALGPGFSSECRGDVCAGFGAGARLEAGLYAPLGETTALTIGVEATLFQLLIFATPTLLPAVRVGLVL